LGCVFQIVQSGRVLKSKNSWVSDDENRLPIQISVGSIKADLDGFRGLNIRLKLKK
jgi:hypothetical protein